MESNLYVVTRPTEEPITPDEARLACRVDVSEDDFFITGLIAGARQWGEVSTGRAFVTQTWELKLSRFPCGPIEVPMPPLVSVTSIKYLDTANVLQTLAVDQYVVTAPSGDFASRGRITPAYSVVWPSALCVPDAVRVVFVAGYGAASAVPQGIKNALLQHVAEAYNNRERPDYSAALDAIFDWAEVRFD